MWLSCLSSGKTDHLCTAVGESGSDEDRAETLEATIERTRVMPVLRTNIATVISWDTANVDNNGEDYEAAACQDLDAGEHKLDFSVPSNAEDLHYNQKGQEYSDPDGGVDVISPELDGDRGGREFEGKDDQPAKSILPANSKSPGFVNEPQAVCIESTVDRIEHREFAESLHCAEQHETGNDETNHETGRATSSES